MKVKDMPKRKLDTQSDDQKSILTPVDTEGGNTSNPLSKPYKNWFFTWNNYPDTWETVLSLALQTSLRYAYQEEKGESGTPHIQGCVEWKNARHFGAMKKIHPAIHWETTHSTQASIQYCTDYKKRKLNGIVRTKGVPKPPTDYLTSYHPWQLEVLNELKGKPNDRTVNWIYDRVGKTGKSIFLRHLKITQDIIGVCGSIKDIAFAIKTKVDNGEDIKAVFWDITRSDENKISYRALEMIKNGYLFSTKYESAETLFDIPHIYIFANFPPDTTKLSQDRWCIREIIDLKLTIQGTSGDAGVYAWGGKEKANDFNSKSDASGP